MTLIIRWSAINTDIRKLTVLIARTRTLVCVGETEPADFTYAVELFELARYLKDEGAGKRVVRRKLDRVIEKISRIWIVDLKDGHHLLEIFGRRPSINLMFWNHHKRWHCWGMLGLAARHDLIHKFLLQLDFSW